MHAVWKRRKRGLSLLCTGIKKWALVRGVLIPGIHIKKIMDHFMAPSIEASNPYGIGFDIFTATSIGIIDAGKGRGHQAY